MLYPPDEAELAAAELLFKDDTGGIDTGSGNISGHGSTLSSRDHHGTRGADELIGGGGNTVGSEAASTQSTWRLLHSPAVRAELKLGDSRGVPLFEHPLQEQLQVVQGLCLLQLRLWLQSESRDIDLKCRAGLADPATAGRD